MMVKRLRMMVKSKRTANQIDAGGKISDSITRTAVQDALAGQNPDAPVLWLSGFVSGKLGAQTDNDIETITIAVSTLMGFKTGNSACDEQGKKEGLNSIYKLPDTVYTEAGIDGNNYSVFGPNHRRQFAVWCDDWNDGYVAYVSSLDKAKQLIADTISQNCPSEDKGVPYEARADSDEERMPDYSWMTDSQRKALSKVAYETSFQGRIDAAVRELGEQKGHHIPMVLGSHYDLLSFAVSNHLGTQSNISYIMLQTACSRFYRNVKLEN